MRIAVPIWEDKISPVLDAASRLLVIDLENRRESSRFEIYLDEQDLTRRCYRMKGLGVDILICGAVSRPFMRMLDASGIEIIPGITGPTEDVLQSYLHGNLKHSEFKMPGFKGVDA